MMRPGATDIVKTALLVAIAGMGTLLAADFAGRWTGKMEANGSSVPIFVTLNRQLIGGQPEAGNVTGTVATGDESKPVPIQKARVQGDTITFEVDDNAGRVVTFRLTLTGTELNGESIVQGQTSKVSLSQVKSGSVQVGGGFGDRNNRSTTSVVDPGGSVNGDRVFKVGGGVSPPSLIYKVDPEYTEQARAANYQGVVVLYVEIGPDGTASNFKVLRSLGLGLDEKAIEAVKQWKFRPAQKDGQPVTVAATIEVNFRL